MHDSKQQAERRLRGENFQEEIRRSWRLIPNCWRLRITDGVNRTGTRPGDDLILLEHINILCEEKRAADDRFTWSLLRPDQRKGLREFEAALQRNRGLVFISFLYDTVDEAYAFRLVEAAEFMGTQGRQYITLAEFQQQKITCVPLPLITVDERGEMVRAYDLKGVQECYK